MRLTECLSVSDFRLAAKRRLPRFLFEFIDLGSEDGVALNDNIESFRKIKLQTRFLVDLSKRDMSTQLFGMPLSLPLATAPTGMGGFCWYSGEVAIAKAAAEAGIPFTLASTSDASMETVAREAGGRLWFQIYMWRETHYCYEMIARARDLGFEALVVTIDQALGRSREHNERNKFSIPFRLSTRTSIDAVRRPRWLLGVAAQQLAKKGIWYHANHPQRYQSILGNAAIPDRHEAMTWDEIAKIRDVWPGRLIVKSVLSRKDAQKAIACGADAIVVSNHGGRALDSAVSSVEMLPEIAAEVGKRIPILVDGGVRRGSDIAKALGLGAAMVLIGRAPLYGAAVAGQPGVAKVFRLLADEFEKTLAYLGCRTPAEVDKFIFADNALRNALSTGQDQHR
ncbi:MULTISPECIES: alpha-hydroxy acid oxidase [unclassified Mesorhizobium]|uniref:alpha-hydroxy acid oxidase n=1 Tax=unclassified Mesorhizobium TaxID=325217 RepID=UPI001093C297|nr:MULTISPECIES: alpha-hydroxy acid oxidase [unclassified Mesorhizobium]TGQ77280.1 alpha-hydroxy-acid oxidizing protein [Mesorhizobium sp. M8A.F.Ca.ET.207.01.1.1]TGS39034.1 alpha-hydroxy-acid oxidizing protein [Mesorhizobium sp. M8A.F.Ca.ET.182.01.1.1]TGS77315.1 alpha-hydroxy-acid oxidizing protein [Mesorhizobium sp. M8A.F.Ca.ET.181.01.1.1]TGT36303.1 alpha-hydroxy-acid oxidizing protein [Mesorhizobium sp. M8A.F.Ca.ET.165.01.1.1]